MKKLNLADLEKERFEWSNKTFVEATAESSLDKLKGEIKEIESELNLNAISENKDLTALSFEYADAVMCIFDSAGRAGISIDELTNAFKIKLGINKLRKWKMNPDKTYSHC